MNRTSFPKSEFSHPALPSARRAAVPETDIAGDRILLTLLALGLMLLAFFVVLTTAGTLDQRRIRDVAKSVQINFQRPEASTGTSTTPSEGEGAARAGVAALRAAVAGIFANVITDDQTVITDNRDRPNPDRVEVDVPLALFFGAEGELNPLPLLDRIVAVLSAAPPGYKMELFARAHVARGEMQGAQEHVGVLADALVRRGLAPTMLTVGVQQADRMGAGPVATLRFSFLLLEAGDDVKAVRLMGAR